MWTFFLPITLHYNEYPSRPTKCEMIELNLLRSKGSDSWKIWNASSRAPQVNSLLEWLCTLTTSVRVPTSRRHRLYAHPTQILGRPYAHIPERVSTNWLKLVGKGTGDLRSGNKMFHCKSFIGCELYMSACKTTGLFICLPRPLYCKFHEARTHVWFISVFPAPNIASRR